MWEIPLTWTTPPLSMNRKVHWAVKSKISNEVKDEVIWRCRLLKIPPQAHITFTLHYRPATKRRRDVDSLVAVSKVCLDAVVKAGVVPDDTPEFVDHRMPVLEPVQAPGRLWAVVAPRLSEPSFEDVLASAGLEIKGWVPVIEQ